MTNLDEKTVIFDNATRVIDLDGSSSAKQAGASLREGENSTAFLQHHDELPPGTRLGEFEIRSVIGVGGFSIVYLATDHLLKRTVALKEYMPSTIAMRSGGSTISVRTESQQETFMVGLRSFINEAQLLARFDHPALVKVYRFWEANGTAYMVMPNYDGATLKEILRQRVDPPDEQWIKALLRPLMEALAMMHDDGCYHRDIAPDNIILKHDNQQLVLLDLGAARRVINEMTQMLTVILKPGYAPVEQYAEAPGMKQGPWTDIYALGALVHFLILGEAPLASVSRLLNDSYVPLMRVVAGRYSERFLHAVDTALSVRPENRPQSIGQLAGMLGIDAEMPTHGYRGTDAEAEWSDRTIPLTEPPLPATQSNGFSMAQSPIESATSESTQGSSTWWAVAGGVGVALLAGGLWLTYKPAIQSKGLVEVQLGAYTPADEFKRIATLADPTIRVTVALQSTVVKIGKDYLKFSINSDHDGYVYIFMVDADGKQYRLLFPNEWDTENRITSGQTITLPGASWPMIAGSPPGTTRFLAMVSREPREFSSAGATAYSIFKVFLPLAQAKSAAIRTSNYSPFAGKPFCGPDTLSCNGKYGAVTFEIHGTE
ncbi:serine/threonine-protein kinase [Burkholderia ubonensis]|uniref:serine/threonine-protein kinase n=1 Tax=Burkholderia ubonensis TaxID=101571 RepID=UPI0009B32875|nr:serine/threonine-protein kinase [Burkholderia ubonensis]